MTTSTITPVKGLKATGRVAAVDLSWDPHRGRLVDHYEVYAARDRAGLTDRGSLLTRTLYPHLSHTALGAEPSTWHYTVITVVDSGARSGPARAVSATTTRSVTTGRALAQAGEFDHKGLEFALSPNLSAQFPTAFPNGVDYQYGTSTPGRDWCYLHPGPLDSWAGRKVHTFTLRFSLDAAPERDLAFALWLTDAHATLAGKAELAVNDAAVKTLTFTGGATRGSVEGDATRPGSPLKPSHYELPMAASLFRAGENVLSLRKTEGSWIAYDALGVFEQG